MKINPWFLLLVIDAVALTWINSRHTWNLRCFFLCENNNTIVKQITAVTISDYVRLGVRRHLRRWRKWHDSSLVHHFLSGKAREITLLLASVSTLLLASSVLLQTVSLAKTFCVASRQVKSSQRVKERRQLCIFFFFYCLEKKVLQTNFLSNYWISFWNCCQSVHHSCFSMISLTPTPLVKILPLPSVSPRTRKVFQTS